MENVEAKGNRISKLTLKNTIKSEYKAYGVKKITNKAMMKNINLYKSLSLEEKNKVNYYTLIRKNIKKVKYCLLKSNKYNLCEANFQKDLNNFKIKDI